MEATTHTEINVYKIPNLIMPGDGLGEEVPIGILGYAKHRLAKFKGIPKVKFKIHLKETEFRFNSRGKNIYIILLKNLRDNPLI